LSAPERGTHHATGAGARRVFIYYRVSAADALAAIDAAKRMQTALRARHPGLEAQLMRRTDDRDPNPTLMETYAFDARACREGIDVDLRANIERCAAAALSAWIIGGRHVEVFDACA
jgi:hypothetical protein